METTTNTIVEQHEQPTVAQLAVSNPGALAIFTKYNIDYCCGGHRSLQDACNRIGLDPAKIQREIDAATPVASSNNFHPERWTSSLLVDYILENHHHYIRKAIPEIEALLDRVCERHGHDSIEVVGIRDCFADLTKELLSHMEKEETILFPTIKKLETHEKNSDPIPGYLEAPINVMEHEHESAGELVKEIRSLSNNYTPPDFACPTFKITYQRLREFDNDLMQHIHLENNILFERFKTKQTCSL